MGARLIDEDQPLGRDGLNPLQEVASLLLSLLGVVLSGAERLFFRVQFILRRALPTAEELVWKLCC